MMKIKVGMTRDEVTAILGEPDDVGGSSRKYPTPSVYKYGETQYFFQPWKNGGLVYAVHIDPITHERKVVIDEHQDTM